MNIKKEKSIILVLGLPCILKKHYNQVSALPNYKFNFIVNELTQPNCIQPNISITKYPKTGIHKLFYIFKLLHKLNDDLHHLEIYPGGRLSWLIVILGRLFNITSVVIERGDLTRLKTMSYLSKISLFLSYRFANKILYKEHYMADYLKRYSKAPLLFIPNAISTPKNNSMALKHKHIDFLWVNRMPSVRKITWFINALSSLSKPIHSTIIGFQTEKMKNGEMALDEDIFNNERFALKNRLPNVEYLEFSDPHPFYPKAKFFVLPSEYIFGNFSLLESMSYGVVPIVSRTNATSCIVIDGKNGLVADHSENGFKVAMNRALDLSQEEYHTLSTNAIQTISSNFSLTKYAENMRHIYQSIAD